MNKLKVKALLSILVLSLALTGCASKDDKPAAPNAQQGTQSTEQAHPSGSVTPDATFKTEDVEANITKSIDSMYPGDWAVEGTTLKKGTYTENKNFGIADAVGALYPGSMVSIFVGEARISSTVKNNTTNERVLEGYPTPAQVNEVMTSGKTVAGGAGSMGSSIYNKLYMPIKSGDKTVAVLSISIPK